MPSADKATNANDMYVSARLTTAGLDGGKPVKVSQETDVHWRAPGDQNKLTAGSFNWRMVFDVELGQLGQRPNRMTLECWDKDPMTFSKDFLGSAEVD